MHEVRAYIFFGVDEVVMEDDWAPILGDLQNSIFTVLFSYIFAHRIIEETERGGTRSRVKRISMFLCNI